jgi:hypothetical protein
MIDLKNQTEFVETSILKLDRWVDENGWEGYDPYDLKGTALYQFLLKPSNYSKSKNVALFVLNEIEDRYPFQMRDIFKIKKQLNAKALGLFAKSYLNLYQSFQNKDYLQKAENCLKLLLNNNSKNYQFLSWGYPFDWQAGIFIPKGTPSSVVCSIVGDAFWEAYVVTGKVEYLDVCRDICNFFLNDLNIDEIDENCICFSYTPLDHFHVHNANLFVGEFLSRIGKEIDNDNWIDYGKKAANYAVLEQNTDGSIYYWGRDQNNFKPNHSDHYHTGFEIRLLFNIWKNTGDIKYYNSFYKYFLYYQKNFFLTSDIEIIPKMTPALLFPINIHSCSESILCNATLAKIFPESKKILFPLTEWIVNNLQTEEGWFIYKIKEQQGVYVKCSIPFIRWGEAWMMLALSEYLKYLRSPD